MSPAPIACGPCTNHARRGEPCTHAPIASAARSPITPNAVVERTAPGRILYDQIPIASASGIVSRMLDTPHALSLSEFTTTSAIAANATIITRTIAIAVAAPVTGLT
jgi:hypothetical protein